MPDNITTTSNIKANNYLNHAIPPIHYEQHPLPGSIPNCSTSIIGSNYEMHKPLMQRSNNPSLSYERVELKPVSYEHCSIKGKHLSTI